MFFVFCLKYLSLQVANSFRFTYFYSILIITLHSGYFTISILIIRLIYAVQTDYPY